MQVFTGSTKHACSKETSVRDSHRASLRRSSPSPEHIQQSRRLKARSRRCILLSYKSHTAQRSCDGSSNIRRKECDGRPRLGLQAESRARLRPRRRPCRPSHVRKCGARSASRWRFSSSQSRKLRKCAPATAIHRGRSWDGDRLQTNIIYAAINCRQHHGRNFLLLLFDRKLSRNGHRKSDS